MKRFAKEELLSSPAGFVERRSARFQDVDAAGIVFFPRLFEYFHDAFVGFLDDNGVHLPSVLAERRFAAPLKQAEAEFLSPLRFGDAIEVAVVRADLDGSELAIGYRITAVATDLREARAAAVGQTVHVFIDPGTRRRLPPPAEISQAVARLRARSDQVISPRALTGA